MSLSQCVRNVDFIYKESLFTNFFFSFLSPLQTPERKIKGHVSTGHAESPATIVVGRAYSTTVRTAGRVPKVVKNPILKLNMNMDESFTGKFL